MKTIKTTQSAYAAGGAIYNGIYKLTEWYEASATDEAGNQYRVIWEITSPDEEDASYACNWDAPWAVLDEHNDNVADSVEIILN